MKKILSVVLMLLVAVCVFAQRPPERVKNEIEEDSHSQHIYINKHKVTMRPGENITLEADAFDYMGRITWKSSNSHVAYVDHGKVYARDCGECRIYASIPGASEYCEVIVTRDNYRHHHDYKLTLNDDKVVVGRGEIFHLQLYVNGSAEDNDITYSTDDSRVATIDRYGVITGRGIGTTTITVKYGNKEVTCDVRVIRNRR